MLLHADVIAKVTRKGQAEEHVIRIPECEVYDVPPIDNPAHRLMVESLIDKTHPDRGILGKGV